MTRDGGTIMVRSQGVVDADLSSCDECGTCISVCPADAIVLSDHLEINRDRCTGCGTCVTICPFGCLRMTEKK
jgi:uncharacterized protein